MSPHQAAAAWQRRQAQTLAQAYSRAWAQGAANYRAQHATPPATARAAPPPTSPARAPMAHALGPAMASLARMAAGVVAVAPAAGAAVGAVAAVDYVRRHAYLLAGGASVVWAGEQAGYAQAADADGLLLEWELDPDPRVHHCVDCPALAGLPPLPLALWPTLPGEGLTECSVGCKCSLRAVVAAVPALTAADHELLSRLGNRQPVLVAA